MILILRHFHDPLADEVARMLGAGARMCRVESWIAEHRIQHQVGSAGVVVIFEDRLGRPVLNEGVVAVFNRVRNVPPNAGWPFAVEERDYFAAEAEALLWSCLDGLACPVINPPESLRRGDHPKAWAALAARCALRPVDFVFAVSPRGLTETRRSFGLPSRPGRGEPGWLLRPGTGRSRIVWVVPEGLWGALDGLPAEAVRLFVAETGIKFGSLRFAEDTAGAWRLANVDSRPEQAPAGALRQLVDALAALDRTAEVTPLCAAAP